MLSLDVDMQELELWWYGKHLSCTPYSYGHLPHSHLFQNSFTHARWVAGRLTNGTRLELCG